jgi:hypothetical protein
MSQKLSIITLPTQPKRLSLIYLINLPHFHSTRRMRTDQILTIIFREFYGSDGAVAGHEVAEGVGLSEVEDF